jgi:methylated-DNA-[protein]-cysteine S-methyltransferase
MPHVQPPASPKARDIDIADIRTPLGVFRVGYHGKAVTFVDLLKGNKKTAQGKVPAGSPPAQLLEYFQGKRKNFDVKLEFPDGSEFDRKVWVELARIPYGKCLTYGEVARLVHKPQSSRAVGGAAHRNPIPIIVPCHRLIGAGGKMTGFGLGLWRKEWLLRHEGALPQANAVRRIRTVAPAEAEPPRGSQQMTIDQRADELQPEDAVDNWP